MQKIAKETKWLRSLTWLQGLLWLVVLPWLVWCDAPTIELLLAIADAYLVQLGMIGLAWITSRELTYELSRPRFGVLAFEALVCPPLGINFFRKLFLATPLLPDLLAQVVLRERSASLDALLERLEAIAELEQESFDLISEDYATWHTFHEEVIAARESLQFLPTVINAQQEPEAK